MMVKSTHFGTRMPKFKPKFCHSLALVTWEKSLNSSIPDFLVLKKANNKYLYHEAVSSIKRINIHKMIGTVSAK